MQKKNVEPEDIAKLSDLFTNESSCTTASSEGESNARVIINENYERRGVFEVDTEEDGQIIDLTLESYNPLIHKTTHVVNNMNEIMLFELLESILGGDEDLCSSIVSSDKKKGAINISVEEGTQ